MILPRGTTVDPPLPATPANRRTSGFRFCAPRRAFTLLELLIVVLLVSILAELAITSVQSTVYDQLRSTAAIIAGQLDYARSLAITNNSDYRVDFDLENNQLVLTHSGADTALDSLPATAFRSSADQTNQQFLSLADLPNLSFVVALLGAQAGSPALNVTDVEFGPLGETTRSAETVVWLAAGFETGRRYLPVHVSPVTGLVSIGELAGEPPAGLEETN